MTDQAPAVDEVLEQVIAAARAHLAAIREAEGAPEDEQVWRTYVTLNNLSHTYDQLLLDEYGEVTPWEIEPIDLKAALERGTPYLTSADISVGEEPPEPYPAVVSVRQRRDFKIPSVPALLNAAREAASRAAADAGGAVEQVAAPQTAIDAIMELVRDGEVSLAGLDVPELEPVGGVVAVVEVAEPLVPEATGDAALFTLGATDRVVSRLDEPDNRPGDGDQTGAEDDDGAEDGDAADAGAEDAGSPA